MNARQIIEAEDPKSVFRAFSQMAQEKSEAAVLDRFRRGVRAYIKWIDRAEEGYLPDHRADFAALRRARTFQEIEAILAKYDDEPSFLSMVYDGYFI